MKNVIEVFHINEPISIEDFSHEIWQNAAAIEINRYWSAEIAPVERCFVARLLWTDEELFIRFDCKQNEPFVVNENPNITMEAENLWERDVCEIFIAPDLNEPERYFEFEIAPTAEWLDFAILHHPEKRETDKSYNAGMRTAAQIAENHFTVIFSIEFERAFGKKPKAGDKWAANLFRCVGAEDERGYLAWQPTQTELPNFHVPAAFGLLKFTK